MYGGRGGGKSFTVASLLLIFGIQRPLRVLCAREYQVSIRDSVHRLLADRIEAMGLSQYYDVTQTSITGTNGTEFVFKGLHHNAQEIKSFEGADIAWIEEAQAVSAESWDVLIPTIRKANSEIWLTFNPLSPDDATWQRFVLHPPPGAWVQKVLYSDNPWFPSVLEEERRHLQEIDPELYQHIWLGEPRTISDAQVFKGRYLVQSFETPVDARFYHGVDWGFANDPTVLVRCFISGGVLYIDRESYGVGVELDETPALFDSIETAKKWIIKADSARPETISFMRRRGYKVEAAKKWAGSIEDGLAVLKSFDKIIIHPRCVHTAEEFFKYSYKTDRNNGDVLPIIIDAYNHCIDALRYALDGYIHRGGGMRINLSNIR
jgi:phage terminase large subunit